MIKVRIIQSEQFFANRASAVCPPSLTACSSGVTAVRADITAGQRRRKKNGSKSHTYG
jgi:hypothetical protein